MTDAARTHAQVCLMTMHLPDNLPNIARAKLPASYEAARTALSTCSSIDECAKWANKAEALASYAKQAHDDELRKLADRIQARAIRRCGELLKTIEPAKNQHSAGKGALIGRGAAAKDAGLSLHQQRTAMRIANVPHEEFERQVESGKPPTVTRLAQQGKQERPLKIDLKGIPPEDFARATEAGGTLKRFAEFCTQHEPRKIARAFFPKEVAALRRHVAIVDAWLDAFVVNLPE